MKTPNSICFELFITVVILVVVGFLVLTGPVDDLTRAEKRTFNVLGLWFQLFGVIVISFEFLRGPLAKQQNEDYEGKLSKHKSEFNEILKLDNNKEKLSKINNHMKFTSNLNHKYFSVINFDVTVRVMYWLGFILVCLGYLLQLVVA